jgi:folate-binding protein YgfZ
MDQATRQDTQNPATQEQWWRFLKARGATLEGGRVLSFGEPHREVEALARGGLVPLLGTTPLRLTGPDRLEFLHGQVSHEVKNLQVGEGRPALMLNVRGHALALMRLYRRDEDLFVAVEGAAGERVKAQLKAHIIFDQVELSDLTGVIQSFTLQGAAVGEILERALHHALPEVNHFVQAPFESAQVLVSRVSRSTPGGVDLHVLTRDASALARALERAGAQLVGERALAAARVAAGIAEAEFEGGEGVLPQEAGLDYALSYRKGCYLGQEIMARIEARGNVRRRLVGLQLKAHPHDARDLLAAGKVVGRLGTVAEHPQLGVIALASVRSEVLPGTQLAVGDTSATVTGLPFNT